MTPNEPKMVFADLYIWEYSDPFFSKTLTTGQWPLEDLWPHFYWGQISDSTDYRHTHSFKMQAHSPSMNKDKNLQQKKKRKKEKKSMVSG